MGSHAGGIAPGYGAAKPPRHAIRSFAFVAAHTLGRRTAFPCHLFRPFGGVFDPARSACEAITEPSFAAESLPRTTGGMSPWSNLIRIWWLLVNVTSTPFGLIGSVIVAGPTRPRLTDGIKPSAGIRKTTGKRPFSGELVG